MRTLTVVVLGLQWLTQSALVGAADDIGTRIDETLAAHVRPMALEGVDISGPGAERLISLGREAAFVALGESHLNNETPRLAAALLEALKPAGYEALAIETGPMIAEYAEAEFRAGRGDALAGLFAEVPFTAAFIDHAPEFDLIERAVELDYALWGLDQVFIGGARFNLDRLVELAPDEDARRAARAALERAERGFATFAETGDRSGGFLVSATESDYEALRAAFRGVEPAGRIIDELAASSRIYRLFGQGRNYRSNHERIELMKRHLAGHLRETSNDAKVFMKFGAVHMQRGYSPLNQLDLGNAAAALGFYRGGGSLHVLVVALTSRDTAGAVRDWTDSSPWLKRFQRVMPDGADWAVFDLRALRPLFHAEEHSAGSDALARRVWGYDLLVVAREFTRAVPLPGVPEPPG